MSIEHFFLSCPALSVPERWCEAFVSGQVMDLPAVLACLRRPSAHMRLVWLSSEDTHWMEHLRQIQQAQPSARVVLLSNRPDMREGLSALNEGVCGYTHAYAIPELLREVALVVEHGGLWVGPDLMRRLVGSTRQVLERKGALPADRLTGASSTDAGWGALSARESEVAHAVSAGRSNKEVAALLHISERTVKAHLGAVYEKLGVRDRLQLVLHLSTSAGEARAADPVLLP